MKFTHTYWWVLAILLLNFNLFAQSNQGSISGLITNASSTNNEEIIGAVVQLEGTNIGTVTDYDGKFHLAAKSGDYTLTFSYTGFKTMKRQVSLKSGIPLVIDMVLEEESKALNEVVVVQKVQKSSSVSMLLMRKNAAVVSDGVSADMIKKTPDRNVSDVLKRVTGASIQEGKFAIIRGMNDRYNAGYLDNVLLPSTEADRKAFSFDIVPANLIDNLQILKTGSADMVGDFGGGIIKINTKSVPERWTQNISLGGQYISNTSFANFKQFASYPGENFNILNDKRDLPNLDNSSLKTVSSFPTLEEKERLVAGSKLFTHDWSNRSISAPLNLRFSYGLGFPIKITESKKLGLILALNYSDTRKINFGEVNSYDGTGQVSDFKDEIYQRNTSEGALLNVNYVADKFQIHFRNLFNSNFDRNSVFRTGIANITDQIAVNNIANYNNYNQLTNHVLSVKNIFGDNFMTLNTTINYSSIKRMTPDYKIASYTKTPDADNFALSIGDFFNTSSGKFFSDLSEHVLGANIDLSKSFKDRLNTTVKVGGFYQTRDRDFYGRSFVYQGVPSGETQMNPEIDLASDKIGINSLYLIEKTSDDVGYYQGKADLAAAFIMFDQVWFKKLKASYGIRYEDLYLKVSNDKMNEEIASIKKPAYLPSINLNYSFTEKINLRAAYFSSVNRPEFRELAPFAFYVFDKNAEIRGNENLKVAQIDNFDLRFEFYPTGLQLFSIGAFYKKITNPVEYSIDIAQSSTTFTFQNEKSANVLGFELEARKNLSFLGKHKQLQYLNLFGNAAITKSTLNFLEGSKSRENRPLQGQSPFIFNGGLNYDNSDIGWSGSISLNRSGRRIAYVGVDHKFGATRQDIFEAPRTILDFQIAKNFKKFNLKLTFSDLLRQKQIFYQDANQNGRFDTSEDREMFKYQSGWQSTLTISHNF
jgi:outer membrane receptor protein involved in Fe transport